VKPVLSNQRGGGRVLTGPISGDPAAAQSLGVEATGSSSVVNAQHASNVGATRVAVIFVNYGPYHLARARALIGNPGLDPYFIELAPAQNKYPWQAEKSFLGERLITMSERRYDDSSRAELGRKVVAVLRGLKPRLVILAGYSEAPMRKAAQWAKKNGCGVVLLSESTAWDHRRRWWFEIIKRWWVHRYVQAAVVGGQPHRSYMAALGVDERLIWDRYNVVDNDFFARACAQLRAGAAQSGREEARLPLRYFLYVGRFAPEKNLAFLLRAYAHYRQAHTEGWRLVMVGDGPQREELHQIAQAEGLTDVIWPGFKQSSELPLYYAFAGCFILPSILEPWGLVVNEAMASGLPILASRRCGCATDLVIQAKNGFTFNPYSIHELFELLNEIAGMPEQARAAMGSASTEIISQWSPAFFAAQVARAAKAALAE
jgi:1,2-diacylglycerol 3-alpha-glucosyltransferase